MTYVMIWYVRKNKTIDKKSMEVYADKVQEVIKSSGYDTNYSIIEPDAKFVARNDNIHVFVGDLDNLPTKLFKKLIHLSEKDIKEIDNLADVIIEHIKSNKKQIQ